MADPYTALIMAAIGGANEATTGREQQTSDAKLKATAYRMLPYLKSLQPESFPVHQTDVLGGAVQGFSTGAGLGNMGAKTDFLNSATAKNNYDMGMLDTGKQNGENLDLSGNATGASGYRREGNSLQLLNTRTGLSGDRQDSPYRKLSLMNGYNF
jgi:hypothetical protein